MTDKEKFLGCAAFINKRFDGFLRFYGLSEQDVIIDPIVVGEVCRRYFADLERVQSAHGITLLDNHKLTGYMAYWLTKLKPVSVVNFELYKDHSEFCLYINEIFSVCLTSGKLLSAEALGRLRLNDSFLSAYLYLLKYRVTTGDNLAVMNYLLEKGQR